MAADEATGGAPHVGGLPLPDAGLSPTRRWSGVAIALVGLPVLTWVLVGQDLDLGSVLLLFVLGDVAVAAVGGLWPGILAAATSLFAANWFLTPPYHTLAVKNRDSIVELVVFALVAIIVSVIVEVAARDRGRAARSTVEALLLSLFAAHPAAELSLTQVLENVCATFGMTSAALIRSEPRGEDGTIARVDPPETSLPSIRVPAGGELVLVAHGPVRSS